MSTHRTPPERWNAWQERDANRDSEEGQDEFALRADGKLIFFDEQGWFLLGWGDGTEAGGSDLNTIYAWDSVGRIYDVYCEPMWLVGYVEHFYHLTHPIHPKEN